jgi:hypothetical protein
LLALEEVREYFAQFFQIADCVVARWSVRHRQFWLNQVNSIPAPFLRKSAVESRVICACHGNQYVNGSQEISAAYISPTK